MLVRSNGPPHAVRAPFVLAMTCAGCILLVHDDPGALATTCHFSGDTSTQCGMCIAGSCTKQVNACCAEPASLLNIGTCASTLTDLNTCGSGGDRASCSPFGGTGSAYSSTSSS